MRSDFPFGPACSQCSWLWGREVMEVLEKVLEKRTVCLALSSSGSGNPALLPVTSSLTTLLIGSYLLLKNFPPGLTEHGIKWPRQKHEVSSWGVPQTRHKPHLWLSCDSSSSDTRGGQEELDNGHDEHSPGSGEGLTCMIRDRCTWSGCLQDMSNVRTDRRFFLGVCSVFWGNHEQNHSKPCAGSPILSFTILPTAMKSRQLTLGSLVGSHGLCPCGTCVTVV